jgi:uncharacterized membrane protein YfcA
VTADQLLGVVMIGMGVGFLSGAFGKGGSAVATPLLHLIGIPAIAAIASPLPATIPSTWLASRPYARAGNIDRRVVRIGLPIGIPATVVGALLTRWIPGGPLIIVTDVLVLAFGLRILISTLTSHAGATHAQANASDDTRARVTTLRVVAIVGAVGFVSGLLGNSGGFLLAPLFMAVLGMPIHRALGTSLLVATCLAVPGTLVHWWLGHIDWSLTLAFGIACVPAAIFGAQVALRTSRRSLSLVYGFGLATMGGSLLALAH